MLTGNRSPLAVPAGHYANMEHLMEHYRQRNQKEENEKLERLREKRDGEGK